MYLTSTPSASSLTASAEAGTFAHFRRESHLIAIGDEYSVPFAEFIEYGVWFAGCTGLTVHEGLVRRVSCAGTFRVERDSGEAIDAASVILASGHVAFAWIPPELDLLRQGEAGLAGVLSHSADPVELARFA